MTSPPEDPYAALGVSRDAQIAEIRSAHRKLVLKCHPDKVQDPELKAQKQDEFQKVQQAYEILSDDAKRQKCDDMLKLAELRKQRDSGRANSSATRSTPSKVYTEFEIRTAEPRPTTYKTGPPPPPPGVKIYPSYSRSWDDEKRGGSRYYEAEIRMPRREKSYPDKPSKREVEREREKEKERDREREREKRRAKKEREAEDLRRAAKKEEKRAKEKQRSKEHKREKEEKRRERDEPYLDSFDDDAVPLSRKSSSKKYEERRDRPLDHDEPIGAHAVYSAESSRKDYARAYIHRSRASPERSYSYHGRGQPQPPPVPMPPSAGAGGYPGPDDDEIRRSMARSRRGSADVASSPAPGTPRDRTYHRSSRDRTASPIIIDSSPGARNSGRFPGPAPLVDHPSTPPRHISRTHTMPAEIPHARPMQAPRRAQTFEYYAETPELSNRGRGRSRMVPQVEEPESDYEEEYVAERARRPKHRSSRRTRSPEPSDGVEIRYHVVEGGRTKRVTSSTPYMATIESESKTYHHPPARPSFSREASYAGGAGFPSVKVSKPFSPADVQFSHYGSPMYRDELSAARA